MRSKILRGWVLTWVCLTASAEAGVFSLPRFLEPGRNAVGVEPEVLLSSGGGAGLNIRYQQGLNHLSNLHLVAGAGSEPRRFRLGGMMSFDFVPDVDAQPGIGVAVAGTYYRYPGRGQLDLNAIPYFQKSFFDGQGNVVNPFLAIPTGPAFSEGEYVWTTSVALGALFRREGSSLSYILEFGASVNNAENYVSGGILIIP